MDDQQKRERAELNALKVELEAKSNALLESEKASKAAAIEAAEALELQKKELVSLEEALNEKSKIIEEKESGIVVREQNLLENQNESEQTITELTEQVQKLKEEQEDREKYMAEMEETLRKKNEALALATMETEQLSKQLQLEKNKVEELAGKLSKSSLDAASVGTEETEKSDGDPAATSLREVEAINKEQTVESSPTDSAYRTECVPESEPEPVTEGQMRKKLIKEELMRIIETTEKKELDEPLDKDAVEALEKAAYKLCLVKKYYGKFLFWSMILSRIVVLMA
jgi:hypothetical protein